MGSWEHHPSESPFVSKPSLAQRTTLKPTAVEEVPPGAVDLLIDIKEVSRRSGISVSMLHEKMKSRSKYRDSSFPPKIKFGEHTVRYSAAAIERWIQERLKIANEFALSASN
jgi:predicted DNA-binding transcriptional regulator AlpA